MRTLNCIMLLLLCTWASGVSRQLPVSTIEDISFSNLLTEKVTIISSNAKTMMVLVEKNGIVNQELFASVKEVNRHFEKIEGIVECSYSWNHNAYKLVLEKSKAKDVLINIFGFNADYITSLI